jgi:hypothetical protein
VTGTGTAVTSSAVTIQSTGPVTIAVPSVTAVSVTSDNASNTTTLTATPTGSTSGLNFTYQWLDNDVAITGATSSTLTLATQVPSVNLHDLFGVEVTPNNGTVVGATFTSGNTIVTGVNPVTVST